LLQLAVKLSVRAGGKPLRKLTPKLLKAARRRLDVTLKNQCEQTIVHSLTKSVRTRWLADACASL
jgi:hypothetical protein